MEQRPGEGWAQGCGKGPTVRSVLERSGDAEPDHRLTGRQVIVVPSR